MPAYSDRYDAALALAARAHHNQVRKVDEVPYIVHLAHVSAILIRCGYGEDVAIAGLLHDIVEDQDYPLDRLEAEFGPAVAGIVADLTENKREAGRPRPWEVRKQESLDHARHAGLDSIAVKAADVLHSVRSLTAALRRHGAATWAFFSRGREPSLWYYRSMAGVLSERLGDRPPAAELAQAVRDLEQAAGAVEAA